LPRHPAVAYLFLVRRRSEVWGGPDATIYPVRLVHRGGRCVQATPIDP